MLTSSSERLHKRFFIMLALLSIGVKVTYRGRGITKLKNALRIRGLVPEFSAAFDDINRIYRAYWRDRFVKFSRGAGNWPKLAESTLARRRNKNKTSVAILRDTSAMFAAFQPSIVKTQGITKKTGNIAFDVSFGRPTAHYSGVSTTQLMRWHHIGAGRLPARKLIVNVDRATQNKAARRIEVAMARIANSK